MIKRLARLLIIWRIKNHDKISRGAGRGRRLRGGIPGISSGARPAHAAGQRTDGAGPPRCQSGQAAGLQRGQYGAVSAARRAGGHRADTVFSVKGYAAEKQRPADHAARTVEPRLLPAGFSRRGEPCQSGGRTHQPPDRQPRDQ